MSDPDTLADIRKISEEIVQQSKDLGKWLLSAVNETQRKYQREKQQIQRRQELLQATVAQLKEENTKLLEERQSLALETESEAEEIQKLKQEQISIEKRTAISKTKHQSVQNALLSQTSQLTRLRKLLKQEEERSEKEIEDTAEKIRYYKKKLNLEIVPAGGGCVSFIFSLENSRHFFSIELSDTYIIHKASIEEKRYEEALAELQNTQDLFEFIRQIKYLFLQAEKENVQP